MATIWTDPPLEMRRATSEGDYAIAYLSTTGDGAERSGIFRASDLTSAQNQLTSILNEGGVGRIYDKEGTLV
jgi:hypothetical protein